jgi:tetratricopeptide (TPR) repeat protein
VPKVSKKRSPKLSTTHILVAVPQAQDQSGRSKVQVWTCIALVLLTLAVYAPVRQFEFVNYDDPDYVSNNLHMRYGLTPEGIAWALTSREAANWVPLTRASELADYTIFGLQSGWHHLMNVFIHAFAVVLLFLFLQRATGARWPSAFVAAVFALHPLHVESVVWVSERKDVLCAFFWFLSLWAYVRYTERPNVARYSFTLVSFCLGLMSKPMIATLPFVLLLLDFWPLHRLHAWKKALFEKLPFFVLSAAVVVVTYAVQHTSGAVKAFTTFPFPLRIENALSSYVLYLVKTLWPTGLSVFYPYPSAIPFWQSAVAAAFLIVVSLLVWRSRRTGPYFAMGWLWYLGTLIPVIGLIQVGGQSRADRYMYIPMTGLLIMIAWGAAGVLRRWPQLKPGLVASAVLACSSCAILSSAQLRYWQNSGSLFEHALAVTEDNYVAEHNLGTYLLNASDRLPDAIMHLENALRINPDSVQAHTDLGSAFSRTPGHLSEAVAQYRAALRLDPDSAITHNDLGNSLSKLPGQLGEAIAEYRKALQLQPDFPEAHNNLGAALVRGGRLDDSISEFQTALRLKPDYAQARNNLAGVLLQKPGRLQDAISEYKAALEIDPNYSEARDNLAIATSHGSDREDDALTRYEAALRSNPDSAELHCALGVALSKEKDHTTEAIEQFKTALRLRPDFAEAHNNLAVVYANLPGHFSEALGHFEAAVRIKPDYSDAQYNLGMALTLVRGRQSEAIEHLKAAEQFRPDPRIREEIARLQSSGK